MAAADMGWFANMLEFARRRPEIAVVAVLAAHLVVWTWLPILTSPNLQVDLAEGLALGREWQLGYWKHPPLPWWVTDLIYRITGEVNAVYMLGPLAATACMLVIWLLARDIVSPVQALIAALALEGIHFYNFSAVKFAHDQMQLPVWALTALFLWRALVGGRPGYWALAGAMLALAFWTKYSAIALAVPVALFLLLDPHAHRAWRTPGPYLMAIAFALVLAPHLIWLVANDFAPFSYPNARARIAESWQQYLTFPFRWIGAQLFFLLPAIWLLALAYHRCKPSFADGLGFAGRYVTTLALGPFLFVAVIALLSGRLPILRWGYPLWSFLPLAAAVWFGSRSSAARERSFLQGLVIVLIAMPLLFVAAPIVEAQFLERSKTIDFPGRLLAEQLTEVWRAGVGARLDYVTGDELPANSVTVFSPDRPRVIVEGNPGKTPWVDMKDVRSSGLLIVWTEGITPPALLAAWQRTFPGFDPSLSEVIELPLDGWRARPPLRMRYSIIPPEGRK